MVSVVETIFKGCRLSSSIGTWVTSVNIGFACLCLPWMNVAGSTRVGTTGVILVCGLFLQLSPLSVFSPDLAGTTSGKIYRLTVWRSDICFLYQWRYRSTSPDGDFASTDAALFWPFFVQGVMVSLSFWLNNRSPSVKGYSCLNHTLRTSDSAELLLCYWCHGVAVCANLTGVPFLSTRFHSYACS